MNEKRLHQRLKTFDAILAKYTTNEPFARFLAQYFKENKQMGSSDRRIASRLTYNYFRLGTALPDLPVHQRLGIAEFLCETSSEFALMLLPELEGSMELPISEKIKYCQEHYGLQLDAIFPLSQHISSEIDKESFLQSHFLQPDVFIRIHPGNEEQVKDALKHSEIQFQEISKSTLSFANGTKLDQVKEIQGKYEVQDISSQQTTQFYKAAAGESWWDACAGSGGKSIPMVLNQPGIQLLVSDIRNSVLRNLDARFSKAGISNYRRKVIDLTKDNSIIKGELFDGIILDAPCSGSGTWGRTPEVLSQFEDAQLEHYVQLQKAIADQVIKHLKPGKPLIYITCSVFKQENEQIITYLESAGMKLEEMHYFTGYAKRGDTLFAARLIRG